jgi:hypothetical protein
MALSINDIEHSPRTYTVVSGACRVFAFGISSDGTVGGAHIIIEDATSPGSGDAYQCNCLNNDSGQFSFGAGGVVFSTGLSVTVNNAATGWVTYLVE